MRRSEVVEGLFGDGGEFVLEVARVSDVVWMAVGEGECRRAVGMDGGEEEFGGLKFGFGEDGGAGGFGGVVIPAEVVDGDDEETFAGGFESHGAGGEWVVNALGDIGARGVTGHGDGLGGRDVDAGETGAEVGGVGGELQGATKNEC